jgi:hypothetical protein
MSVSSHRRLSRVSRMLDEDVNPMEGAVNIVDAMLVFACGLMLSLVIYWNVDLKSGEMRQVEAGGAQLTEEELLSESGDGTAEGSGFEEIGKVYRDPATGKLYLSENESGVDMEESE